MLAVVEQDATATAAAKPSLVRPGPIATNVTPCSVASVSNKRIASTAWSGFTYSSKGCVAILVVWTSAEQCLNSSCRDRCSAATTYPSVDTHRER